MSIMIHETEKTVREYFDIWLKYYKYPNLKPTSYDVLERTLENHIYPSLGSKLMTNVTSLDVRKLLNSMQAEGYSYSMETLNKSMYSKFKLLSR